jgi:alkylation response protein AidB-like acyl-CoA dehydrogenase
MATLDGGRIGIAAQAVGIAQSAFEAAVRYAGQRKVFGRPIGEFQALRFYIADMATELDAARLLTWRAAVAKDEAGEGGRRYTEEAAIAKLFAAEMAQRVTTKALQIHGGYGYTKEFPVERNFRDARITEIYEGTSEIQRVVISREIFAR